MKLIGKQNHRKIALIYSINDIIIFYPVKTEKHNFNANPFQVILPAKA